MFLYNCTWGDVSPLAKQFVSNPNRRNGFTSELKMADNKCLFTFIYMSDRLCLFPCGYLYELYVASYSKRK